MSKVWLQEYDSLNSKELPYSGFQKGQGLWQESSAIPLNKDPFPAPCAEEAMVERQRKGTENRAECPGCSSTHRSQMWECYVMIL